MIASIASPPLIKAAFKHYGRLRVWLHNIVEPSCSLLTSATASAWALQLPATASPQKLPICPVDSDRICSAYVRETGSAASFATSKSRCKLEYRCRSSDLEGNQEEQPWARGQASATLTRSTTRASDRVQASTRFPRPPPSRQNAFQPQILMSCAL